MTGPEQRAKEAGWLWPKLIVGDKLLDKWDDSPLIWEMPGKILWANKSKRGDQVPWTRSLSASP